MHVRQATGSDAAALARLNAAFNGPGVADAAHIARSLEENRNEIVCIAEQDGAAVGFCCAQITESMCYPESSAEITELYVAPSARRRGAATALLRLAEQLCIGRGAAELRLLTGRDNAPARALYARMGYRPDDEAHYQKDAR